MANEYRRHQRVAAQIARELAPLIKAQAEEHEWGVVTVTHTDVSPDLKHARVYITSLDPRQDDDQIESRFNLHRVDLRHRLARRLRLKYVPQLRFCYDKVLRQSAHVTALIDSVSTGMEGAQDSKTGGAT